MRIPLLYIPGFGLIKSLKIEHFYKSDKYFVPIGCDCHPAYLLRKMHLRTESLPFDWLNIKPLNSLEYIYRNIIGNFKGTLLDLKLNPQGHIISSNFPYAEFYHEKSLINSEDTRKKITKRINRLKEILEIKNIVFLHNIPSKSLESLAQVTYYLKYLDKMKGIIKENDTIHIYIRYDEKLLGNKDNIDILCQELKSRNVAFTKYSRNLEKNGEWGLVRDYPALLKDLKIPFSRSLLPKIYFS
jgi:hypothetical protein